MAEPSGFNTFPSDYDKVNRIDVNSWEKRKVYDDKPYLVLPNFKFAMKLGDSAPAINFFVKKGGEQFGDAITLPGLVDYDVKLKVYDTNNRLQFVGNMTINNPLLGEVRYEFNPLDFSKSGVYHCEVEFSKIGKTFTLPDSKVKYEIIVRD